MRSTLRELEQEQEIADLKRKVLELTARMAIYAENPFVVTAAPRKEMSPTLPERLVLLPTVGMELKFDEQARWVQDVWGCGSDRFMWRTYTEVGRYPDTELPYILDRQHEEFQHAMLHFLKSILKGKPYAHSQI